MTGTEWEVVSVAKVTDGDTLRLARRRLVDVDGRQYWLTDAYSQPIRLVWVDTPERGDHPGWENARDDLLNWVFIHGGNYHGDDPGHPLRVICYESAGWDRLLGDLIDADGNSASQWLMTERGWPAYEAKT
jgi:hypothetical protein